MYSWRYIYFTLHKNPKQKTPKTKTTPPLKKPHRLQTVHAYHTASPGKANEGFLANTHCHDKNNYVQTARSLLAVKSLYTERYHYPIKYARDDFPEFIAQNSNRHRLLLRGSPPCVTAWLLCSGSHFPTVRVSGWSFQPAPQRHTEHHHRFLHLPLWTT